MFQVSTAAANEILAAAERSDATGMALRVAARQLDDGSIEFGMGFDDEREEDMPVQFGDLTVLVGAPSRPLLEHTQLDYVEIEPGRSGFVFVPVDQPTAGCAKSSAASACGGGSCGSCGA